MDEVSSDFLSLSLSLGQSHSQGSRQSQVASASIEPFVYLTILGHAQRRPDDLGRVMGVLLGAVSDDGLDVDIRNSFAIAITENDDEVSVDSELLQLMLASHLQQNPRETLVGWYSTGDKVDANSALIHEYFISEFAPINPLHLVVDADLKDGRMAVKAFVTSEAGVPSSEFAGTMFIPVPATVKFNEADRSVLDLVSLARPQDYSSDSSNDQEASTTSVYSDMESLERAIISIQGMVDNIQEWVSAVKSGEIPANDAIGRYLLDTVSSVPLIQSTDFEKMFNNHLQDLLMVVYLSNLTRTQLAIAQRLQNLV